MNDLHDNAIEAAYQEGYKDGIEGRPFNDPYPCLSLRAMEYAEGFRDGKAKRKQP
jgi:ribosome modulation factor